MRWEKDSWQEKKHIQSKDACKQGKHERIPNHTRVKVLVRYCNG
jgi:hypothetical protein